MPNFYEYPLKLKNLSSGPESKRKVLKKEKLSKEFIEPFNRLFI